jgi:hypothetical protein
MSSPSIGPPSAAAARRTSTGSLNEPTSSPFIKRGQAGDTTDAMGSASKRQRLASPSAAVAGQHNVPSIIAMIRQPLLDLEERIADMTNLAMTTRDVELADDNMSVDDISDDQANKEKLDRQWKKLIYRIGQTMTRKHVMVRDLLLQALAAARKAHLPDVVARLRAALLQYHASAAGECKAAALRVLEDYGGYDEDDDDDSDDDDDDDDVEETAEDDQEVIPSVVCAEAAFLASSLGGSADASRNDWIEAVKSCKTVSRLASLVAGFVHDATTRVTKMEVEYNDLQRAISRWEKEEERRIKNKTVKNVSSHGVISEVWADVHITDNIVMAKAEDYPWWPAKKCIVKDPILKDKLETLKRSVVTLIGERGDLRVVNDNDIKAFTGNFVDEADDLEDMSKEMRNQLDNCMSMARRILRGTEKLGLTSYNHKR